MTLRIMSAIGTLYIRHYYLAQVHPSFHISYMLKQDGFMETAKGTVAYLIIEALVRKSQRTFMITYPMLHCLR